MNYNVNKVFLLLTFVLGYPCVKADEFVNEQVLAPVEESIVAVSEAALNNASVDCAVVLLDEKSSIDPALSLRKSINGPDVVVYGSGQVEPFLIDRGIEGKAYAENRRLNESILFYPSFLKDRDQVRAFLLDAKHFGGRHVETNTTDQEIIHYTHFDRGSDVLLVVGSGMMNQERVASFVEMFNSYDVVIFNHRGIAYDKTSLLRPSTWGSSCFAMGAIEGLDGKKVCLGGIEENDLFAVVYDIFKKRNYKKVYGLGLCYSAPIFAKAATIRPGLFDKLILDSGWIYTRDMINRYALTFGGRSQNHWTHKILPTNQEWFVNSFLWLGEKLTGVRLSSLNFDFIPYLKKLMIPVLFIHSSSDFMVPSAEFRDMWDSVPSEEKVAMITTCGHGHNHLRKKELYKYVVDRFFELSHEEFLTSLQSTP